MIKLSHHGATSGVTGSCHELTLGLGSDPTSESSSAGILIDCGLFQGAEKGDSADASNLSVDFPIAHIRALVVTHVHIDHVGRIPYLLAAGFEGPIICSEPSAIMLPEILEDALKIGFTRDKALIERVLGLIRSRLVPVPYGQWHEVFAEPSCSLFVRFQRAGHILGSAYVECDAVSGDERERVVFSGDLGAPHAPLLQEPASPERADRLVIESTYGDKDHESRETRRYRLKAILERALADGGTVLIPAFSIGRTQELLYEMEGLIHEFRNESVADGLAWDDLEIVVDSPLAAEFTGIYRKLKPFWNAEANDLVQQGRHPLSFEQLTVIDSHADHLNAVEYLASSNRPCVVLAGSGMCAGGRVVNYLKAMLGEARNDVLFVGYQAAGTPGRDILTYGPRGGWVDLDGERFDIRASVHQVGGYSAHAGQSDLIRFIEGIPKKPAEIRIVHGDESAKLEFKQRLIEMNHSRVLIPDK
ncbi:MBL fold metallo-hydrolase RNA specificity domain-containing protein [Marinobacter sp. 2_MG-2023]|uniref:MBL fold metallo-hydrolase RNA specificity domain-containing protein n=1 Tax=Marinobacter sp. 2_MG-2023 TaxID=3062679 RepID=UPI0026E1AC85|nr:MBL fold metallo-hydrolase [Marinobacter sp. 2_MG-2023]MDO6443701.1 MBL fold metallo-hydrolase [Marinobacter sp. 2_MG-2023]